MEERIAELIADLSVYIIALPLVIGLLQFTNLRPEQKAIVFIVLLSALVEITVNNMSHENQENYQNLFYYFYTIAEYLLLVYIYSKNLKPLFSSTLLSGITILFLFIVSLDMICLSGIRQFNGYSTAIEGLILIFFAVSFFYKTLQELKIERLEQEPLFWVSTGVLLYFSSSLFIFLFTNYVAASNRALFIIWGIHGIFNTILYIFYSLALWTNPKS